MRRHDLDWLRVLVFALLIFYHVGMFFVPWSWHINNPESYDSLQIPMYFLNRWRLPILFVISGMGTYFALGKRSSIAFAKERWLRLGIPLAVGILFIVPPQVYIERLATGAFNGNYFDFWPTHAFEGVYPEGNFSWHHLWFLPYLLTYSLLWLPIFRYFKKHPEHWFIKGLQKMVGSPIGLFLFCLPLMVTEWVLEPLFEVTHALVDDWYTFTKFFFLFGYGFMLMTVKDTFFNTVVRYRKSLLMIGIAAFALLYYSVWEMADTDFSYALELGMIPINYWAWILTLFGFAGKYLNQPSGVLTQANEAVYPFYILHQTITLIIAYFLLDVNWGFVPKFTILVLGTFAGSWVIYLYGIKPWKWVRPLFGMKNR
ncbi:acyltransferase family protein [Sediminicola luteus]|uniref:Glucan biosynthesis protein n=1 Tax=Sediminicola luteus TaxID=319238 RepID=A0A2A4G598_9FLAO|nr:acyltransferase family protein [Sediminicola luteus]PCE63601.1 glucan biosynthesis protein [Sediminicola luteus]